jgi:hypothetical protein
MVQLKLGQREHMEQFRKGQLYMNTLKYFRDLECDPARADHYEGATHIFQPKDVIITLSAPGFGDIVIDSTDLAAATTLIVNAFFAAFAWNNMERLGGVEILLAPHARIDADQHAEAQIWQFYFVGLPQKRGVRLERHRMAKLKISSARYTVSGWLVSRQNR